MSISSPIETALAEVETLLAKMGEAMQAFRADELQLASVQLRDAALRFSQALQTHGAEAPEPAIAVRARTVAVRLGSQRDALARLSALIDRQVSTVVPEQAPASTYGATPASRSAGAARIYKSAG